MTLYDYGPALVDIRFVAGDDFNMVVNVEGDVDADTFAAALRYLTVGPVAFTCSVGSYNAGTDSTPVTVTMADTTTDDFAPGEYLWDLEWTTAGGVVRTVAGGTATVLPSITT